MARGKKTEDRRIAKEEIQILRDKNKLLDKELKQSKDIASNIQNYIKSQKEVSKIQEKINSQKSLEKELTDAAQLNQTEAKRHIGDVYNLESLKVKKNIEELKILQNQLSSQSLIKAIIGSTLGLMDELTGVNVKQELSVFRVLKWLIEQDKTIKEMNLSLGISGVRAEMMRKSMSDAAFQTQILSSGIKELTEIQASLADETGRVRLMTVQSQIAIAEIAKGTALGATEAGKLAGHFQNIGIDAQSSNKLVQDIVDQTERMGVNTTKVLQSVISNFKQAQRFYFKRGVTALAEMSAHAEKFKTDVTTTFAAAEKARTLEGAIEMAAQLRLAGAEFSRVDPFKLLFQARNEAEKFQETLQKMTRGMAFFSKETGQFQVSAAGMDQLRIVSDATGKSIEELRQTAVRTSEIEMMQKSIPGFARMDKALKETVEGMAVWNTEARKFEILDPFNPSRAIDIRKITKEQLKSFAANKSSLEERALAAQGFDDSFKNLINTIKSAFLPLLGTMNSFVELIQSGTKWITKLGAGGTAAIVGISVVLGSQLIPLLGSMSKLLSLNILKWSGISKSIGSLSGTVNKMPKGGLMGRVFGGISGMGMLQGAAAITLLSGSMFIMGKALKEFEGVSWESLGKGGVAIVGLTGAMVGLGAIMGSGIGAAAIIAGTVAIAAMGASLLPLAISLEKIGNADIPNIGEGFKVVSGAITGIDSSKLEELRKTAESLKNLSITSNAFGGLQTMFGDGLIVKFKEGEVQLNVNVTTELDGVKLGEKLATPVAVAIENGSRYGTQLAF